jgi:hypothetical protein
MKLFNLLPARHQQALAEDALKYAWQRLPKYLQQSDAALVRAKAYIGEYIRAYGQVPSVRRIAAEAKKAYEGGQPF